MKNLEFLNGKKILITGATGLIGQTLVKTIIHYNDSIEKAKNKVTVVAMIRNLEKAERVFADELCKELEFLKSDIGNMEIVDLGVNYIVHAASKTGSKDFVNEPVETIMTAFNGTKNILEFARVNPVEGLVYLSSMEVYGAPSTDEKITETHGTDLDPMVVRSCYPECKRMCENLCVSYYSEYQVPAMVIRLTQTFGPGVNYNDGRVFAEFARCAIEKRNIILKTKGETKRNYLYTEDAVNAILAVLEKGTRGEAYNAANEETYCSIYEMAQMVAKECANGEIDVVVEMAEDLSKFGYAPTLHMNLDTSKIRSLGWNPQIGLTEMFNNMIQDMSEK